MNRLTLDDIESLVETTDIECKAAQGRDGTGEIPASFWQTYSAMANTSGGFVFFGVEETNDHRFVCKGLKDIGKMQKVLWDTLHSKNKVKQNVLNEQDVEALEVEGKQVLRIKIPRARRQDRPVYLGENPLGNTYIRRHEGDYRADEETVKRMIAEAVEDSRDDRVLENFGIDDLDKDTLNAYRNRFSALKPDHPWLELSLEEFLERIGALGKNRQTGKSGLRVAGLLMFGRYETIREEFPFYMVDYQERPEPKNEPRWVDRIIPDGTWSGNLYDFYQKTIRKLTADLKVPFKLQSETRIDDTPVHQALREALTNTLIHADYTGRISILVVKRPDLFGFRNPGLMRIPEEQAVKGGISDCRNHRIQDMFRYIGLGEHAGSGIPGILKSWKSQHWRAPLLYEDREYEQTLLELLTSSLLPEESINYLNMCFGEKFSSLSELQRIILVTAEAEGKVSHTRIRSLCTDHPKDISSALAFLVREDMLVKEGETRAALYYLAGSLRPSLFTFNSGNSPDLTKRSQDLELNSPDLTKRSQDLELNSPDLKKRSLHLDLNSPDLSSITQELKNRLSNILLSMGFDEMPKKLPAEKMKSIILQLCGKTWISLKELSVLLNRDSTALQNQYLTVMVSEGMLKLKYPDVRNHPDQAYGAAS